MFIHEIEIGQRVFIDANIFVYHFSKDSRFNKSCRDFLLRIENSEVHGVSSAAVTALEEDGLSIPEDHLETLVVAV